jgi:hypothetical protein
LYLRAFEYNMFREVFVCGRFFMYVFVSFCDTCFDVFSIKKLMIFNECLEVIRSALMCYLFLSFFFKYIYIYIPLPILAVNS